MTKAAWENLSEFLQLDSEGGFAIKAMLTRAAGGEPVEIIGIFDEAYLGVELGEFDMDSSRPRFQGDGAALAGILRGDQLRIHGKDYEAMTGTQQTGDGWAVVELELVER